MRQGPSWPVGELSLAKEIGKLHGFRRWCEVSLVVLRAPLEEVAPLPAPALLHELGGVEGMAGLLRPARVHLACKFGRRWCCLSAWKPEVLLVPGGAAQLSDAPNTFHAAMVRYGPGAGLAGAALARLTALWTGTGAPATVLIKSAQHKRPLEAVLSSVIERALAQGHLGCLSLIHI